MTDTNEREASDKLPVWALIERLIAATSTKNVMHAAYMGRAMPTNECERFFNLRDEKIPQFTREVMSALAALASSTQPAPREITEGDIKACFPFQVGWNHSPADKARYRTVLENYERRASSTQPAQPSAVVQEPVAWADDSAIQGKVGNVCSTAAKRYWEKSDWVDKKNAELHKHPLYTHPPTVGADTPPPVAGDVQKAVICNGCEAIYWIETSCDCDSTKGFREVLVTDNTPSSKQEAGNEH